MAYLLLILTSVVTGSSGLGNALRKQAEYVRDGFKSQPENYINHQVVTIAFERLMPKIIIQLYEVQTPGEAEAMIELGIDHIGSVILSESEWKIPKIWETVQTVRSSGSKSCLIPLFQTLDVILRTIDYYQPDIIHFCDALTHQTNFWNFCQRLIELQEDVKKRFPNLLIMRSIPIVESGMRNSVPTLDFARKFEPSSDFFLTDTLLVKNSGSDDHQPVSGFIGITGQICSWEIARQLVESSRIPVILAGGISPYNVVDGLMRVKPAGVDSCTQTNALDNQGLSIRFKKDTTKVQKLVAAVRGYEKS
jgi:phosphoribosylanthranilate isomerase